MGYISHVHSDAFELDKGFFSVKVNEDQTHFFPGTGADHSSSGWNKLFSR